MRKFVQFSGSKWMVALALPVLTIMGTDRAEATAITFSNVAGQSGGTVTVGNTVVIGDNTMSGTAADGRISMVAATPGPSSPITGACGTFGCLELATGAFVGADPATVGVNDYLYSGSGSYIRVFGDATADAGNSDRLLYAGSFDPTQNLRLTFDNNCPGPNCSGSLTGTVAGGTLNAFLAAYLGVPTATTEGNATTLFLTFAGNSLPATGFPTGSATANTNSIQTFDVAQVPDGGSTAALLGSVLVALGMLRRRIG